MQEYWQALDEPLSFNDERAQAFALLMSNCLNNPYPEFKYSLCVLPMIIEFLNKSSNEYVLE